MKVFEIPLSFVKVFLIETNENGLILIDSGTPGSGRRIIEGITRLGKNPNKIKSIIFTHSHADHIGGAYEVKRFVNDVKFGIDKNGVDYLKNGKIREPVLHSSALKVIFSIGKPFLFRKFNGVNVDFVLEEGEFVKGVEIIKTSGHTNDSVSIYLPELNAIIVGDTLQGDKKGLKYPNIYEDFDELMKSVEKIKSFNPSMVHVSHGVSSPNFLV
ncbi:MBL fold metallo-hydrolase [Saccharolobus islandicus]|uniref:Beta-lactamase domain protein n=3 Tax=Saccharolobus islandicus TaxID=43080 RepID=C4KGF4_SACI6|nr:MBL fold metallo-hydrolase [Sulfolobus islandicus]ACP37837.1 beta-lactamase domain protein [Sulfolobus islandicus M.14.25]ACP55030.1 beta-lactamase domain protein [Sulfolobus islandicus M.16.27]ACR41668.1 beta-lactamase domain protein [Sulfolobus islandicus M.16.4]